MGIKSRVCAEIGIVFPSIRYLRFQWFSPRLYLGFHTLGLQAKPLSNAYYGDTADAGKNIRRRDQTIALIHIFIPTFDPLLTGSPA